MFFGNEQRDGLCIVVVDARQATAPRLLDDRAAARFAELEDRERARQ
jgi:hypothetical protein